MSEKRKILISICSVEEFKHSVREAFEQYEAAGTPTEPVHRVFFTDTDNLFSTLSPKRMELLKYLKTNGPLSCRKLAAGLSRAYANVHEDVRQLSQLELITKDSDQLLLVPWDEIDIAVPLTAS